MRYLFTWIIGLMMCSVASAAVVGNGGIFVNGVDQGGIVNPHEGDFTFSDNLTVSGSQSIGGGLQIDGTLNVDGGIYTSGASSQVVFGNGEYLDGNIDKAIYVYSDNGAGLAQLRVDGNIYGNGAFLTGIGANTISGLTVNSVPRANADGNGVIDSTIYDVNGSVGIGTDAPMSTAQIHSATDTILNITTGDGNVGKIRFGETAVGTSGGVIKFNGSTNTFSIGTALTTTDYDAMFIVRGNNNVGIGDSTPSYALDVSGSIRGTGGLLTPSGTIGYTGACSGTLQVQGGVSYACIP